MLTICQQTAHRERPTRSAPAPAEDERRATEDESGTTSAPRERSRDPTNGRRSAGSTPRATETAPPQRQPRRRSQPSQHRRAHPQGRHTTPRAPSLLSPPRPISRQKHRTRRQFRHFLPLISQPRTSAATVAAHILYRLSRTAA